MLRVNLRSGTRFARPFFRGAEAPRFHRLSRAYGAVISGRFRVFFCESGRFLLTGGSVSLQARDKLASIEGVSAPGRCPPRGFRRR